VYIRWVGERRERDESEERRRRKEKEKEQNVDDIKREEVSIDHQNK
jgi:hypothetical protein